MNAQALFQSGLSLHQQGQIESAKQMYEAALALTPDHFDALHLLGVIAAGKGEAQEAIAYIS
ncbi:MAG: tetratricopeptide repeat protein, partial [Betaproteobacteria bacterium]